MDFIKSGFSPIIIIFLNAFLFLGINDLNYYGLPLIILGSIIYFYNRHLMGGSWSLEVKAGKIVTKGLFKYIRHPLYLGMMLICLGLIISTLNLLLLAVFIFIDVPFVYARAFAEEKVLLKNKKYKDYVKRTGMFFPSKD